MVVRTGGLPGVVVTLVGCTRVFWCHYHYRAPVKRLLNGFL